ncbi:hypothetical protein WME91_30040 [Sorangium sp. So ce269]
MTCLVYHDETQPVPNPPRSQRRAMSSGPCSRNAPSDSMLCDGRDANGRCARFPRTRTRRPCAASSIISTSPQTRERQVLGEPGDPLPHRPPRRTPPAPLSGTARRSARSSHGRRRTPGRRPDRRPPSCR